MIQPLMVENGLLIVEARAAARANVRVNKNSGVELGGSNLRGRGI
jgi:hypothetical protein